METVTVKYRVTKMPPVMPFFTMNVCLATTDSSFVLFFNTNFTNFLHITIIKLVTGWVLKQGMSIRMAQNCLAEVGA